MNQQVFKRISFYVFALLIPIVLVGGSEFLLRTSTEYEDNRLAESVPDTDYDVISPTYYNRYFSTFKPSVSIAPFQSQRSRSSFRILAVGGSTMAGYPYSHHYAIPSILELNLKKAFPEVQFEVINTGVTAFNSFGIVDIAEKLPQIDPDAIIVYAGHNEFYGTLGSASTEGMFESAVFRRLYLRAYSMALFQFGKRLLDAIRDTNKEADTRTTTMNRMIRNASIELDSELYSNTISDYSENLDRLISSSTANRIPIILSTLVSNLKDQPPLDGLDFAYTIYEQGKDLFKNNNVDSARVLFSLARDYDQVRFRASSDINNVILDRNSHNLVHVVDIEQSYRELCTSGIEDDSCFTDHLHPTLEGYGLIASKFFERLTPLVSSTLSLPPSDISTFVLPTLDPIEDLLSDINIKILTSAPPFTTNPTDSGATYESLITHLSDQTDPVSQAAVQILTNRSHPSKVYSRLTSDTKINTNPFFYYSWSNWDPLHAISINSGIQQILTDQIIDESIEVLLLRASNRFDSLYYYNLLGALYLQKKEYPAAKSFLSVVERKSPMDPSMLFNMAVLHYETGEMQTAMIYQNKFQQTSAQIDSHSDKNSPNQ